nr:NAD(P)/FAD-dependent oxidoreductase [Actinomycetales bacterium]
MSDPPQPSGGLPTSAVVAVIGAGQAGLTAAYHLRRRGLAPGTEFVVLDANPGPGGAWRHRWDSLTLGRAHAVHDLPGFPLGEPDPDEPASAVVARYYGAYEREFSLPVVRPVRVVSVTAPGRDGPLALRWQEAPAGPPATEDAEVAAEPRQEGILHAEHVISASGTWDSPYVPYYPGIETFGGRQLHTRSFSAASEFSGQRVVVVGAGTSAVQFLLQLDEAGAHTVWVTRREPEFVERPFDPDWGREVEERVRARTSQGLLPGSVVSHTGLPLTEEYREGIESGVLVSAGAMERIVPGGIVLGSGERLPADVILWATGFRHHLGHLSPLRLRETGGGIRTEGVHVVREPRLSLVGYGASASTLGATRAGRQAASAALRATGRL